eukprot:SAG31_NODE_37115_length_307_cov_0.740385_1_plen_92_part_01
MLSASAKSNLNLVPRYYKYAYYRRAQQTQNRSMLHAAAGRPEHVREQSAVGARQWVTAAAAAAAGSHHAASGQRQRRHGIGTPANADADAGV